MYLFKNIRHLRKKKVLTQEALGELLSVKKETVSGYERGTGYPSFDILSKLVEIFEVSFDDLITRDIENEGLSGTPKAAPESKDGTEDRLITLLEQRVKMLEREIARVMPEVAEELGIEVKRKEKE